MSNKFQFSLLQPFFSSFIISESFRSTINLLFCYSPITIVGNKEDLCVLNDKGMFYVGTLVNELVGILMGEMQ